MAEAMIRLIEKQEGLSQQEAVVRVQECDSQQFAQLVFQRPARDTNWNDLDFLSAVDPELAATRWEEMVEAAHDELASGHRPGHAVESPGSDTAWQRAQYVALADELADGWQPRHGLERTLVDMMAQALTLKMFWMRRMMSLDAAETPLNNSRNQRTLPRLTASQAIDQAAAMVERFDRMFSRALQQLRDLRKYVPTVILQNAGQVNVGGAAVLNGKGTGKVPGG